MVPLFGKIALFEDSIEGIGSLEEQNELILEPIKYICISFSRNTDKKYTNKNENRKGCS